MVIELMHDASPAAVRRIAVRSVLWDDIVVEVPSTATMAEFRVSKRFLSSYLRTLTRVKMRPPCQVKLVVGMQRGP